jgi:DNA replication protein DnaC
MTITEGARQYADGRGVPAETVVTTLQAAELVAASGKWADRTQERRMAPDGRLRLVTEDAVPVTEDAAARLLAGLVQAVPDDVKRRLQQGFNGRSAEQNVARADQLLAESDAEALAAGAQARKVNRYAAYLRNRNPKYAGAAYPMLKPDQDVGGRVSRWWLSPSRPRTLLMCGVSRTGKTTAGYAIANHAHATGAWVEVFTEVELSRLLRGDDTAGPAWARATECDLLFLDDWGRARATDWWKEQLQELLDVRFAKVDAGLRMLVSANTPSDKDAAYAELVDRYGDPIFERVIDGGGIMMFDGPRIRNVLEDW